MEYNPYQPVHENYDERGVLEQATTTPINQPTTNQPTTSQLSFGRQLSVYEMSSFQKKTSLGFDMFWPIYSSLPHPSPAFRGC